MKKIIILILVVFAGLCSGALKTRLNVRHGQIEGVNQHDHVQYLPISGVTPMFGDLDMSDYDIDNIGNLDAAYGRIHQLDANIIDVNYIDVNELFLSELTALRLVSTDSAYQLVSTNASDWIAGTASQITVTNDGDGTVTLGFPAEVIMTFLTTDTLVVNGQLGFPTLNPGGCVLYLDGGNAVTNSTNLTFDGTTLNVATALNISEAARDTGILRLSDGATPRFHFRIRDTGLLTIMAQDSPGGMALDLMTKDGSGNDTCGYNIFGVHNTPTDTNFEQMFVGYIGNSNPTSRYWQIAAAQIAGTGITHPLKIYTGTDTDQLILNTNGTVSIENYTGILKGTAGVIGTATAGTDYQYGTLTAGRIPYSTGSPATLTDAATLLFDGTNVTGTGYAQFSNMNATDTDDPYKIAGSTVFRTTGTYNVFIGENTGDNADGTRNVFIGKSAGLNNDTTGVGIEGEYNIYIGASSGQGATPATLNTGFYNTGLGYQTFYSNTSGAYNFALGVKSLVGNTTGSYNFAAGYNALYNNTTGGNNVGIGHEAIYNNNTGIRNTAIGFRSLGYAAAVGAVNYNTMLGYEAGYTLSGNSNIFIGYKAGYLQGAVSNLLIIDNQQRGAGADITNAICYGVMAATPANQTLRINALLGIGKTPTVELDVEGDANVMGVLDINDLTVNGTATQSVTLNFGGGGSGDCNSMTFTAGVLTGYTTVP